MEKVGVVVIGRNEGARLAACLDVVRKHNVPCVYVDSQSTDDSVRIARGRGADVISFMPGRRFFPGEARNVGFARLISKHPGLRYVQFIDGDTVLNHDWLPVAAAYLDDNPWTAVVCGRLREENPERSVYNLMCDIEWDAPAGEVQACGGITLVQVRAFTEVGGFPEHLAAGEEPEMCQRIIKRGYQVIRLENEMAYHDAAITRFGQWWKRAARAGYAYAEVSEKHRAERPAFWRREYKSILFWGLMLPLIAVVAAVATNGWGLLLLAAYLGLVLKIAVNECRRRGVRAALLFGTFCTLAKFPQCQGAVKYLCGKWYSAVSESVLLTRRTFRPRRHDWAVVDPFGWIPR